jgi:tetraacyldisaccharide 4'-kinase
MTDLSHYFKELVAGERQRVRDRLLLVLLKLASHPYALVLRLRAAGYRLGLLRSFRLPCPVISVGNITLGGTGKTPTTALLAAELIKRGRRVAVLSRGYGGSANGALRIVSDGKNMLTTAQEAGDEPYLLAQKVPGLMVVIGADRYQAGLLALRELKPDLFILDDGFQHLRLHRDLNLLLLDCARPFANGRVLPAGFLREPLSALNRADLVLFTRCAGSVASPSLPVAKPSCRSSHRLAGFVTLDGGAPRPFKELKGKKGLAFAGIADPEGFYNSLEQEGISLVATLAFSDHISYGDQEIASLCRLRDASRAQFIITTEKDAVKLEQFRERLGEVHVAALELCLESPVLLEQSLEHLLSECAK